METINQIRTAYPYHLAKMHETMRLQENDQVRVHELVNLFEETLRYLALTGLALYRHHDLHDSKVEAARQNLARPSLGHWLTLLQAVNTALENVEPRFLTPPFNQTFRNDAIAAVTTLLNNLTGSETPKRVRLIHFFQAVIEFRNKKIGHGRLTNLESRQAAGPLEAALGQWLAAITLLADSHLLYINQVSYEQPDFICLGTHLNRGTNRDSLRLLQNAGPSSRQVYLYHQERLISLDPFLTYDSDLSQLYIFSELSGQRQPTLRCPYATAHPDKVTLTEVDGGVIVGAPPLIPATVEPTAPATTTPKAKEYTGMRNWYDIIQPHADIRKGNFDEAVFAADIGDVTDGKAPPDYNDPYLFYKKTYLTAGLKGLLHKAHDRLAHGVGASVIQIKTPFGGGKTHALVALYHYLKHGEQIKELLPPGLAILQPRLSVINGEHFNPIEGRTGDGVTRYTFWGEVAYQLGGRAGYEQFRANDEARVSPGKEKLRDFLATCQPFIILFDEILQYVNRALDVKVKEQTGVSLGTQTFSFFQELSDAVATLDNGLLVVTLPVSRLEDFGDKEEVSLARMGKIFGRVESIETPVEGQEVYAVIRRRLFEVETLKEGPMQEIVHHYFQTYQSIRDDLPAKARELGYRDKMALAYPFHPDVIDILYEKWSTYPTFQRTRGVLRLLANVIEDLYQREISLDMILPGDLNLEKAGVRQDFLKHIGSEYEGVIASDVAGHEAKAQALDRANRQWKHLAQRIASAIFFHSFSADDSEKGINLPYIKLAVLRPDTIPALVTEVLQKQANLLWYLNSRGDNYYFSKIPNLNRMILDKKELYNDSYEEELRRVVEQETGAKFRNYVWPETADNIPDNRDLKLLILRPEDRGDQIAAWIERKGQSFREYKNTLFFAVADTAAFTQLREEVKTYLALKEIDNEIKADDKSPLTARRSEIQSRMHNIQREYSYNVRRMYHLIYAGTRRIDLGQPVSGNETLGNWYWRELGNSDVGAIVEQLHYRVIVNRVMVGNEQVALDKILDQFYKNTDFPAPASPDVVARAIQLGVQDGAFGLALAADEEVRVEHLRFQEVVALGAIAFEPGIYLVSQARCEALREELRRRLEEEERRRREEELGTEGDDDSSSTDNGDGSGDGEETGNGDEEDNGEETTPATYKRLRLVIGNIPASRIADVNRGIFMPLSASADTPLTFTMTIEVHSKEGVAPATLENKVKETIRQIGAVVVEESKG
jgi:hypothetical protein